MDLWLAQTESSPEWRRADATEHDSSPWRRGEGQEVTVVLTVGGVERRGVREGTVMERNNWWRRSSTTKHSERGIAELGVETRAAE
jgi:hypothetical protein